MNFLKEFDLQAAASNSKIKSNLRNDGWGEGGYMKAKQDKLKSQFLSITSEYTKKSNIFSGVSIWVNGYTIPSSDELKLLIIENGGEYQHYFSKTHVTHVIACNITESKIKDLKRNDKIVHPDWIVDSVKCNQLLPLDQYLLYSVAKRDGTVLNFASKKRFQTSNNQLSTKINTTDNLYTSNNSKLQNAKVCPDDLKEKNDSSYASNTIQALTESNISPCKIATSVIMESPNKVVTSPISGPSLSHHEYSSKSSTNSKAGDPNFISEFYANSRLHHLAMWKSELKRFASSIQSKRKEEQHIKTDKNNGFIMHIDLDSFFVSVSYKLNPALKGKPVAVCHSTGKTKDSVSWSEIASCSYEARSKGVKNGMLVYKAKELCPALVTVCYNFDEYRNVSQQFYEILSSYTCNIEAVSCDEALVDITHLVNEDQTVLSLAEQIRSQVYETTGCIASCGIACNILIARLATKQAKPNGVCFISNHMIKTFIKDKNVRDLPGIGRVQHKKLEAMNIFTLADLQTLSLSLLEKEFGKKNGGNLFNYCRGKDERSLEYEHERKSVSAEINYGMRFTEDIEVQKFIFDLSKEVEKRLKEISRYASKVTFKLMVRSKDAGNPLKYLGHGKCDTVSKSQLLPTPTNDATVVSKNCCSMLRSLRIPPADVRGIGIQMTNLSDANAGRATTIFNFIKPTSKNNMSGKSGVTSMGSMVDTIPVVVVTNKESNLLEKPLHAVAINVNVTDAPSNITEDKGLYNTDNWDLSVIKELPEEIQQELRMQFKRSGMKVESKFDISPSKMKNQTKNFFQRSPQKKSPLKKSPSKSSPLKKSPSRKVGRGRPKKMLDTNKYFDIRNIGKSKHAGRSERFSASTVDMETVDMETLKELPVHLQLEIVSNFKSSNTVTNIQQPVFSRLQPTDNKTTPVSSTFETKNRMNIDTTFSTAIVTTPIASTIESKTIESTNLNSHKQLLLSPSQLDKSFLNALPSDVRDELLLDIKSYKQSTNETPNRLKTIAGDVKTSINGDTEVIPHVNSMQEAVEIDSIPDQPSEPVLNELNENSRKRTPALISPSQLDRSFLNALPQELRDDIIKEAQVMKKRKINNSLDSARFVDNENFHNISKVEKQVVGTSTMISDNFLSPSQVDQNVLAALPVNIQREVHLNAARVKRLRSRGNEIAKADVNDQIIEEQPLIPKVCLKQILPNFRGVSELKDIKSMLRTWINEYPEPYIEDVDDVVRYFEELLTSHNMETLFLLLKLIRRAATRLPSWRAVFNIICVQTQVAMKKLYNGTLAIELFQVD